MAQNGRLCQKKEQRQRKLQKSSSTYGLTFDTFQQIFSSRTDSHAKFPAQKFLLYAQLSLFEVLGLRFRIMTSL